MPLTMKKSVVLTLVAVLFAASAAVSQIQFAVGVKGGPNFTKLDVNSSLADNYSGRTGFHGGAFALIKLTKIGIQPEVIFSRQGSKLDATSVDFDYVNIPVMLKLYTIAGINLQLGPQFGFLNKTAGELLDVSGEPVAAAKSLFKKSDFSLAMGAGWDLPFGLMVEARYNLGLAVIQNDPRFDATKNQVFQVSLGYKLIKIGG